MLSRRTFTLVSLALATSGCGVGCNPTHSRLGAKAGKEDALRIDAAAGFLADQALTDSFKRLYPEITLDYRRAPSQEIYANFLREAHTGQPTADIVISAAMDLQFKLVNDGFAQAYESPEKTHLPEWAVWKNEAYAITADPVIFAYNKALMPPEDVPDSHDELTDLLVRKRVEYRGKIATYDPQHSGTGYLYYTQDLLLSRDTLDLVRAVGRTQPKLYVSGAVAGDKLVSGEHLFAYNMANSFMVLRQLEHPIIGIVFPSDYTLVMSRIAFIPKMARHAGAGRLFLDFLLSELGQALIARQHLQPIRIGVPSSGVAPAHEVLRRIHFGPSLLANLDEFRRRRVLHEWRRAFES